MDRYARQRVFSQVGKEGQERLLKSRVCIIGMGALGTVSANSLCRSGVGHLRMVDRDYVELTNLQRQVLYTEEDVRQCLPKAIAAHKHLSKVNSEITLEHIVADVNPSNIESLISGSDLVLDATDNWEIRILINEACHKAAIPWIYCGALGSEGMTLNILNSEDSPCLMCFIREKPPAHSASCSTYGVMNMVTGTMASIQASEAVKILLGSEDIRRELLVLDLWENYFQTIDLAKDPDCPLCVHGVYEHLGKTAGSYTTDLCGSDAVQIVPPQLGKVDFSALAEKLKKAGRVNHNEYTLSFSDGKYEIILFRDGRAIIKNAIDGNNAKSIYTEYIGL